ncbi:cobalamin Fe3+-siderophore ABC transporter ATPase [Agrilactobacillus composti DSM 18527 = JCM 14202]|uniref:Cobalamin Fe3+-siderophore ABC transporter ATPase n=2 Tax=Agrilactobacillus TaxID=2767875 RepID=X0PPK1_9LACO|nr:cobalamin Fe3+-siderophore ABC transporter ATPase [Agrilactobacillus composti DSM 18527 = JCM 14202]GAF39572.1 ferrichrome transport ATP-binding protein FhuC [Agrilactobacillus composti DSM 18527 = JCM 14202]
MNMTYFAGQNLTIGYGHKTIISNLNVTFPKGEVIGLIGPNGSGKSTLLGALSNFRKPEAGEVILKDKPLSSYSAKARAKLLASLPQNPQAPGDITVEDLAGYGRYAYQRRWSSDKTADDKAIQLAMVNSNIEDYAQTPLADLSGGQRQRAFIAMTLAQDSEILLLDEPTTYLDLPHQLEILKLIRHLNRDLGKTIIVVLHDLNQAARFCDTLLCLKGGKLVCQGAPKDVFTPKMLADVFNIKAVIQNDPANNCPTLLSYDMI